MQTAAASRMPLSLLAYPPCLIEEKSASLQLATNRAKPILQIDESLLRSMPIDPFDAARTKKRKTLSVEGAVNALRKSEVMQVAPVSAPPSEDAAERTLDIEPDAVEEVIAVAAKLSSSASSLAIPRKTSINTPRISVVAETPAPAPVAVAPAMPSAVAHPAPAPVWSSEVRLRAAAPAPMHAPVAPAEAPAATRSSSMPPPVSMSTAPAAYPMPSIRPAAPASSSKVVAIAGGAFAFLAVAAGVFAISFHMGQGASSNGRAAGVGASSTRSDRVTRVVDPGIRVAAPDRVPTISVTMLPRATR